MGSEPGGRSHIVVAGGGVAALEAVIALRALLGERPAITLVAPTDEFVHQPLTVREPFDAAPAPRLSLPEFAREFGAVTVHDSLQSVGRENVIALTSGTTLPFDKLLVATGAPRIAAYEAATTFRGTADVAPLSSVVADVDAGRIRHIALVVPSGVFGGPGSALKPPVSLPRPTPR